MLAHAHPLPVRAAAIHGPGLADARAVDAEPLPMALVLTLLVAFVVPGLVGHDPWKPDEAYIFGIIDHILASGDWIVPYAGGLPFVEKPPLFAWVGASLARLVAPRLAAYDAARLASGVFVAIALACSAVAARLTWGKGRGRVAALMLAGSLGLVGNAQLMIPDLPLLAGFAMAGLGLVGAARSRRWAGLAIGAGMGIGFLGKGLIAPGILGITALLLPLAHARLRTRSYFAQLAIAAAVALPALVPWPWLLYQRAPSLFREWFWENNIGRFVGFSVAHLGAATERGFYLKTFPWALFPAWVFTALMLRQRGRVVLSETSVLAMLVLVLLTGAVLVAAASARAVYVLPMLPALAVAGAGATGTLSVRFERGLYVLGAAIGAMVVALSWYLWVRLLVWHAAPPWAWIARNAPVQFAMPKVPLEIAAAAALTAGFVHLAVRMRGRPHGGLAVWVGGLAVAWGTAMTLVLPWIDQAKSFRSVMAEVSLYVPVTEPCVATEGLGESERSMLAFYTRLTPRPVDTAGSGQCDALLRLWKTDARIEPPVRGLWQHVWSGTRPGELREHFDLYLHPYRS